MARGRAALTATIAGVAAFTVVVLAGCTAGPGPSGTSPEPEPDPPAACLLDAGALSAATGVTWTPDEVAASDTRCVYDPAPPAPAQAGATASATRTSAAAPTSAAGEDEFLAITIAPFSGEPAAELDGVAAVCDRESRAPVAAPGTGFVCRFHGGSVFAVAIRRSELVTVSVSAVPPGTTAAQLVFALSDQLGKLT
ncbi:hypothetical protein [Pseudonocardia sp. TRM90224]|uniref:hypothetical protein n=1 Tax=Pseudonocardia sp. TRM90224 TaxID=2812678 RepID=UPI001E36E654|nr:hypothetical protein [Pseudonocardia sp. TRM90224]